jgi:hypothetical protein
LFPDASEKKNHTSSRIRGEGSSVILFFLFFTDLIYNNGQIEDYEGRNVEGVGVMKDDELKFEESEVSHMLSGVGGVTRGEGRGEGVGLFYYKR